jgi:hypothetical protein
MFNPSVSTVNLPLTRGVNLSPTERGQFVRLFHCVIMKWSIDLIGTSLAL